MKKYTPGDTKCLKAFLPKTEYKNRFCPKEIGFNFICNTAGEFIDGKVAE